MQGLDRGQPTCRVVAGGPERHRCRRRHDPDRLSCWALSWCSGLPLARLPVILSTVTDCTRCKALSWGTGQLGRSLPLGSERHQCKRLHHLDRVSCWAGASPGRWAYLHPWPARGPELLRERTLFTSRCRFDVLHSKRALKSPVLENTI